MSSINNIQEKSKGIFGLADIITGYQLNSKKSWCISPSIKSISFIGKYYMCRKNLYIKAILENVESIDDKSYIDTKDSINNQVLIPIPLS